MKAASIHRGGEDGEDALIQLYRMPGREVCVTRGDPVLSTRQTGTTKQKMVKCLYNVSTSMEGRANKIGSQLRHSTSSPLEGRTKPTLSAEYVVGLTDGEGCFYVNVWNTPTYRAGAGVQLHFHIKLSAHDQAVLEAVRDTLGCGAVYYQKETRSNHTQCYRYTVSSQRDIFSVVIPFFNNIHCNYRRSVRASKPSVRLRTL